MTDGLPSKLVLVLVENEKVLNEIVTGLLDAGVTDATVLNTRSLGSVLRQDMPIFAGVAKLLPESRGGRMIMAIMPEPSINALCRFIDEMRAVDRPTLLALPIERHW